MSAARSDAGSCLSVRERGATPLGSCRSPRRANGADAHQIPAAAAANIGIPCSDADSEASEAALDEPPVRPHPASPPTRRGRRRTSQDAIASAVRLTGAAALRPGGSCTKRAS